jgi:D-lyxose ketol-isomerase
VQLATDGKRERGLAGSQLLLSPGDPLRNLRDAGQKA